MKVIIACKLTDTIVQENCDYIGVDKGALSLARNGISMACAIGDFDSIHPEDMALIRKYSRQVITLNPIKDDTDGQAAIEKAIELGYETMEMIGGLGGRIDHELINLRLAMQYPGRLIIKDERNLIMAYPEGIHPVTKGEYPYFSFFTDSQAVLTLQGFVYPLEKRVITYTDLYTVSNELVGETGTFINEKNPVLLIRSRDEKKDS